MKTKVFKIQQGGSKWLKLRCGTPTASRVGDIVTADGKATKSAARRTYLAELVYERLTGRTVERFVTAAMQRGTESEPKARAWYSITTGEDVAEVGFVRAEWGGAVFGASPDGLVGADGGIEIKVPTPVNLCAACLCYEPPAEYMAQVQANLWVTGRKWWDLVLFGPEEGLPSRTWRILPDAALHEAFETHISAFVGEVKDAEAKLREMGAGITEEAKLLRWKIEDEMNPTKDW